MAAAPDRVSHLNFQKPPSPILITGATMATVW